MRKIGKRTGKRTIATVLSLSVISTLVPFQTQAATQKEQNQTVQTQAVNDTGDDWLHTDGSDILDKNGNVVRLTGANWFGFNCCECMLHGLGWGADLHSTLKEIADRGINLLRIPVSTELLLAWKDGKKIGNDPQFVKNGVNGQYDDNPDLVKDNGEVMSNFEVFDQMMKWCKEYGIKVMVDVHSAAANNAGHNYNLWYGMTSSMSENSGYTFTTQDWIDGWVWLVSQYKDDDTLIACDLKNEPHGKPDEGDKAAKWDDSEDENNWKYAAEKCGNAILDVNPNMLIMIEGIESSPKAGYTYNDAPETVIGKYQVYTNYDGGWWGGNLRMAKEHPVDFKDEQRNKQIVYSPHDYGPKVYMQDWFHEDADGNTNFTEESLLKEYWYDSWAYLVEENRSPLLIGEWGGFMDGAGNEKWMNTIADYMNKKNISHTFWCINPNSGDTGGLIQDDWKTWDEKKYALLKKTLWQSADGKFVGLDHQKALGKNGITIDEYYGNSQTPTKPTIEQTSTEAVTTTIEPTSTEATTEEPTATEEATTIEQTTTEKPTATTEETTTIEVTTTEKVTTTTEPTSTEKVTTTTEPTSTEKVTTTTEPTSTEKVTTTEPAATTEEVTTVEQTTTEEPTATTEETTTKPEETTTKSGETTTKPEETTTKPQEPTTTKSEAATTTRKEEQTTGAENGQSGINSQTEENRQNGAVKKVTAVKGLKFKHKKATTGQLSWKKQKVASKYRIYRYDKKTKKYRYYKTTKKNYILLKKLKKKETYLFRVRACQNVNGRNVIGAWSKKIKVKVFK